MPIRNQKYFVHLNHAAPEAEVAQLVQALFPGAKNKKTINRICNSPNIFYETNLEMKDYLRFNAANLISY